jgi:hypothetical protein
MNQGGNHTTTAATEPCRDNPVIPVPQNAGHSRATTNKNTSFAVWCSDVVRRQYVCMYGLILQRLEIVQIDNPRWFGWPVAIRNLRK